jgi:L-fucose mutarotase
MGHGDEIVLADAFFPGDTYNTRVIRADGIRIPALLEGILGLINLDYAVPHPVIMMQAIPGDTLDPGVEASYRAVIDRRWPGTPSAERIERFAFYERTKGAYAVVMTGETVKYGNIILKKGVIPVS